MTSYINTTGTFTATNGDDLFLYDQAPASHVFFDGAAGHDTFTVSGSALGALTFWATDISDNGQFYGTVDFGAYVPGITYMNVEALTFIGSSNDDKFTLKIAPQSIALTADFDGGAGNDLLTFDYSTSLTDPFSFIVSGNTVQSSFGTFTNFEQYNIKAGSGSNEIHTGAGNDQIQTGTGSADIAAGDGDDQVYTQALTGTIDGGAGHDYFGGQFRDGSNPITMTIGNVFTLNTGLVASNFESFSVGTGAGDDHIIVNWLGYAELYGDAGYDTLTYAVATSQAQDFSVANTIAGTLVGYAGSAAFQEIERAELHGGDGNDTFKLRGNSAASAILLDGGAGADALDADFSLFASSRFVVAPNGTVDSDRGQFSNFERYTLVGGSGVDIFTTGSGDDFLDGNGGDDILSGGAGNDTYQVRTANTQIIEAANAGTDMVYAYVSWTLSDNVENLTLYFGSLNGTGNALDNVIRGTTSNPFGPAYTNVLRGMGGDDTLIGLGGADTLDGGDGIDTVSYDFVSGPITANLQTGTDSQGATLIDVENLRGTQSFDTLIGNGGINRLEGMGGNDVLTGGAGGDTIDGGDGFDTASYSGSNAAVTINLKTGTASGGDATGDTLISIENLQGSAYDDVLTGDDGAKRTAQLG